MPIEKLQIECIALYTMHNTLNIIYNNYLLLKHYRVFDQKSSIQDGEEENVSDSCHNVDAYSIHDLFSICTRNALMKKTVFPFFQFQLSLTHFLVALKVMPSKLKKHTRRCK